MKKVLITGGAGFIGNAIIDNLLSTQGFEIVILDVFSPQIHGEDYAESFLYQNINNKCSVLLGDVRNSADLLHALDGVDYVIHLAAETGTGQSMYELNRYADVNIMGTANLLEIIINNKVPVKKIILASSRSIYGEGMYYCPLHGTVVPDSRNIDEMKLGDFEVKCPECSGLVELRLTKEECQMKPLSFYAYTKMAQEKMLEVMCPTMGIPYTIFRYQNVFGAGQSLNNPYTGILSVFSKLLLQNQPINIFEDGKESRDFIHVKDVASITCNALENDATNSQCINVGSGKNISVLEVATNLKRLYGSTSELRISGDFRKGDIRHNIADIRKAQELCHFVPSYSFEEGLKEFAEWVLKQQQDNKESQDDQKYIHSLNELADTGMLIRRM